MIKGSNINNMKNFNLNSEQIFELQNILGNDYHEVREFYYNACIDKKYKYKIFLTRRSYVLYRIFVAIFQHENPDFIVYGEIYNSHSVKTMSFDNCNVQENKILILDDIIINGRTLDNIFKELKSIFGDICDQNTTVWCIVRNQEANCLGNITAHFGHFRCVTSDDWKKLSNKLTKFIISSNIGYVSFVDTYYIDKKYFSTIENRFSNVKKYNEQNMQFKEVGVKPSILFYQFPNLNIEKYRIKSCVRLYEKGDSITAIPYVFLPAVLKDECVDYCTELLSFFFIDVPNKMKNRGYEVLLYQWTINQLSKQLFFHFCEDLLGYGLSCKESFNSFLCPATKNRQFFSLNLKSNDVNECCDIFKKVLNEPSEVLNNSFEDYLTRYLRSMHISDEQRAKNIENRHKGIKIQDILDIIKSSNFEIDEYDALGAIICSWDIGKSSYMILEDITDDNENKKSFIAGFIRNGEQAYKILYEQYSFQYRVFKSLFLKTYICDRNKINEIAYALDKEFKTKGFGEFSKKINYDSYFSDLISVEPIVATDENCYFNQAMEFINGYLRKS